MHRSLVPISYITPSTRSWTARVLVVQRLNPRESQTSIKKYQKFVPVDKDETKVQAIVYSPDMGMVENMLLLQQTYFISNAKVAFVDPKFRIVPHLYQWIISKTTVVKHAKEESLPRELGAPQFTKFTDIPQLKNSNKFIGILAIVIDKTEQRQIETSFGTSDVQEFFVINDERMPMMMTLWNEVIFSEGQDMYSVKVTAKLVDREQKFWYMSCGNCYKRTTADYLWNITCNFCYAETVTKPRTKFAMILFDSTAQLEAVLFGNLAEGILGLSATELMKKDEQGEKINYDAINERLDNQELDAYIRKRTVQTHYGKQYQYTIFTLDKVQQPSSGCNIEASSSTYPDTAGIASNTL
ncbi:hypothetical protein BUALT_Bualt19G0072700 [Buddleja alternifolia]|uniref:Replication factor A C-terminal domain-containing protein n=1 Tax=Buddleja alternifolia TaxID=168488 RepID=A0AAV6W222_9LAMI|nr:hypothetical protein BUALT_Bualt19G0072700 [Buddleja alternifolia]